jgi:hypothetical protein
MVNGFDCRSEQGGRPFWLCRLPRSDRLATGGRPYALKRTVALSLLLCWMGNDPDVQVRASSECDQVARCDQQQVSIRVPQRIPTESNQACFIQMVSRQSTYLSVTGVMEAGVGGEEQKTTRMVSPSDLSLTNDRLHDRIKSSFRCIQIA